MLQNGPGCECTNAQKTRSGVLIKEKGQQINLETAANLDLWFPVADSNIRHLSGGPGQGGGGSVGKAGILPAVIPRRVRGKKESIVPGEGNF